MKTRRRSIRTLPYEARKAIEELSTARRYIIIAVDKQQGPQAVAAGQVEDCGTVEPAEAAAELHAAGVIRLAERAHEQVAAPFRAFLNGLARLG